MNAKSDTVEDLLPGTTVLNHGTLGNPQFLKIVAKRWHETR